MPFKSEKQRRFLWAEHPELAKRWAHEYPKSNKNLPMYAHEKSDSKEKAATLAVLNAALSKNAVNLTTGVKVSRSVINDDGTIKNANDGLVRVDMPQTEGPTYAGQEREEGENIGPKKPAAPNSEKACDLDNPVAAKLATVLSQALREKLERANAVVEGREPLPVPRNMGIKRYAVAPQLHQLPMGMQPQAPAPAQQSPANGGPVGGGSNPQANPIKAFGPLSASGQLNGNAAFGVKNSPDSSKSAAQSKPCSCGCGDTVATCKCGSDCKCRQPGGSCYKGEKQAGTPAWTRSEGKNPEGGLNAKGRASLKAQGHDIKAPVTESNPSGERAKRQNSFCSRMCGMKKVNTGAEAKKDPDSRINKSLRKWNCKCSSAFEFGQTVATKTAGVFSSLLRAFGKTAPAAAPAAAPRAALDIMRVHPSLIGPLASARGTKVPAELMSKLFDYRNTRPTVAPKLRLRIGGNSFNRFGDTFTGPGQQQALAAAQARWKKVMESASGLNLKRASASPGGSPALMAAIKEFGRNWRVAQHPAWLKAREKTITMAPRFRELLQGAAAAAPTPFGALPPLTESMPGLTKAIQLGGAH